MPFAVVGRVGPTNDVLDGGPDLPRKGQISRVNGAAKCKVLKKCRSGDAASSQITLGILLVVAAATDVYVSIVKDDDDGDGSVTR